MSKDTNIEIASPSNGFDSGYSTHSKTPSLSSTTTTGTTTANDQNSIKNRLESLTDDEIIQRNLRDLIDKKNREERKANGRLVAVIVASLVIFMAIYHAWIRKSGALAGVLVPAVIMVSFGGWVVILAKRDKAKKAMFEKYLEEVAQRNKQELESKKAKALKKSHERTSSNETIVQIVHEISKEPSPTMAVQTLVVAATKTKEHRKNRRHRKGGGDSNSIESLSSSKNSSHYATKDLRNKRPSFRQKLFRQSGLYHITGGGGRHHKNATTQSLVQAVINTQALQSMGGSPVPMEIGGITLTEAKRKRLQRLNALQQPPAMQRIGSVP